MEYVKELIDALDQGDTAGLLNLCKDLQAELGIEQLTALYLVREIKDTGIIPKTFSDSYVRELIREKEASKALHCPRCDSTQIVTGQRGYSLMWGFLGSNKTMNRCASCGYKWEPRKW